MKTWASCVKRFFDSLNNETGAQLKDIKSDFLHNLLESVTKI